MTAEFSIITLFPEMMEAFLREGILARAIEQNLIKIRYFQLRAFSQDKHRRVDDHPYGGGAGMILQAEPLFLAWQAAKAASTKKSTTILFTPQGKTLKQNEVQQFTNRIQSDEHFILVCGRYEGVDQRFIEECVDEEWSIGDFVLSGGELPAAVFIDSICRLLPGVLGNKDSLSQESFTNALLEYPQYTRPTEFQGRSVPEVLLS